MENRVLLVSDVTIDDGDATYVESGSGWDGQTSSTLPFFANDTRWHAAGTGSNTATWTANNLDIGEYEVYATWMPLGNRATDATYKILSGGQQVGSDVVINQQAAPQNDLFEGGRPFQSLGRFNIASTTGAIQLSDDANGFVLADAVRFIRRGDLAPAISVTLNPTSISENGGTSTATITVTAIPFSAAIAITAPGLATTGAAMPTVTTTITASVAAVFADFPLVQKNGCKRVASDDAFVAPYGLDRVILGDTFDAHPHRTRLENHQVPDLEF